MRGRAKAPMPVYAGGPSTQPNAPQAMHGGDHPHHYHRHRHRHRQQQQPPSCVTDRPLNRQPLFISSEITSDHPINRPRPTNRPRQFVSDGTQYDHPLKPKPLFGPAGMPPASSTREAPMQASSILAPIPASSSKASIQRSASEVATHASSSEAQSTADVVLHTQWDSKKRPPVPEHLRGPPKPTCQEEVRTLWIGDLADWMTENHLADFTREMIGVISLTVMREHYELKSRKFGFIEFATRDNAEAALQLYNTTQMPRTERTFRLNWATFDANASSKYRLHCGNLPEEVSDFELYQTFKKRYSSVINASIVKHKLTLVSKRFGFVSFGDADEQKEALRQMDRYKMGSRIMRVSLASSPSEIRAPS